MRKELLTQIEEFMRDNGMTAYTFGIKSVRNGRLVERLRRGGRVWPEQEARIVEYIRQHRAETRKAA